MHRRRARIGLVVAALVLVGGAFAIWWAHLPLPSDGPLSKQDHYGYSIVLKPGESFVDAFNLLRATGDEPSGSVPHIEAVEPDYTDSALKTNHIWVAGPNRPTDAALPEMDYLGATPHDPRLGTLEKVAGARLYTKVQAPLGTQLLISATVTRPGRFLRDGYWITYWMNGHHYRDHVIAQITVCTPTYTRGGKCPFLGEGQ